MCVFESLVVLLLLLLLLLVITTCLLFRASGVLDKDTGGDMEEDVVARRGDVLNLVVVDCCILDEGVDLARSSVGTVGDERPLVNVTSSSAATPLESNLLSFNDEQSLSSSSSCSIALLDK